MTDTPVTPAASVDAHDVVRQIAECAEAIAFQAGVGSSETAGQIVSFLWERPSLMPAFMAGTLSAVDTGMLDHHNGALSWHGRDGGIHRPDPSKVRLPAPQPEALPDRASTHTAAGAGPVGEAVAWRFRFKLGDGLSAWEVTLDESYARSMAVNGGEVEPLYARPVEEPGEAVAWREFVLSRIKALGEGDQYGLKSFAIAELQSILGHVARPVEEPGEGERDDVSGCEMNVGCIETGICYARAQGEPDRCARPADVRGHVEWLKSQVAMLNGRCQLEAGEKEVLRTALTETRERLEKVEAERAEQWRMRRDAQGSRDVTHAANASLRDRVMELETTLRDAETFVHKHYAPMIDSEQALAERISAALTGDAQEAGE